MKKASLLIFTICLSFVIISCSGGSSSKNSEGLNDSDSTENNETSFIEKKDRLLPEMVEADKPVAVEKLNEAFYEWTGVEVKVAGYAKTYGKSEKIRNEIQLCDSKGSSNVLFNCKFKKDLNKEIKADDIVIIKGKIVENSYWGIVLKDCELVSINGEYKKGQTPQPFKKQTDAYWVKDLFDSYNLWMGKEVTVVGHYNSTTTSTTNGNSTWRIDLDDPETGQKMVGCTMKTEPDSDKLAANRDNVKIRGKITRDLWGTVQLEDCVLVE